LPPFCFAALYVESSSFGCLRVMRLQRCVEIEEIVGSQECIHLCSTLSVRNSSNHFSPTYFRDSSPCRKCHRGPRTRRACMEKILRVVYSYALRILTKFKCMTYVACRFLRSCASQHAFLDYCLYWTCAVRLSDFFAGLWSLALQALTIWPHLRSPLSSSHNTRRVFANFDNIPTRTKKFDHVRS